MNSTADYMILPAQPFRLERDMLPPFIRGARTALGVDYAYDLTLLREPTIGAVIPDILVGLWAGIRPEVLRKRLSALECHVLALLDDESEVDVEQIRAEFYLQSSTANQVIASLLRKRAIQQDGERLTPIPTSYSTEGVEIVAIEAKLRRWQEALQQTLSYKAFANKTYVLLDANRVNITDSVVRCFRECSVGLLLQWGHVVSERIPATYTSATGPLRVLAASKLARSEHLQDNG